MREWSACDEDEDVVTMALTAVRRLVERCGVRWEDIGMLQVGFTWHAITVYAFTAHVMHMLHCTCNSHTGGLRVAARPQQVDQEPPDGPLPAGLRQRRGRRRVPSVLRRHGGAARVHQLGRKRGVGRPVGGVRVHRRLRCAGSVPLHERRGVRGDAGGRRRAAGARGAAAHAHGARVGLLQAGGLAEHGAGDRWARIDRALPQESRRVPGAPRMGYM